MNGNQFLHRRALRDHQVRSTADDDPRHLSINDGLHHCGDGAGGCYLDDSARSTADAQRR